jgi:hypothetical protein
MANLTNSRAVLSGLLLQKFHHSRAFWYGKSYNKFTNNVVKKNYYEKLLPEEIAKIKSARARRRIYNLVASNSYQWFDTKNNRPYKPVLFTVTFRENITNLDVAYLLFKKFISRMNIMHPDYLQYVSVPEIQNRGAVHYHIIMFNLPFVKYHILEKVWSYGSCNTRLLRGELAGARYISKYLGKTFENSNLFGKHRYYRSRGLKEPCVVYGEGNVDDLMDSFPDKKIISVPRSYSFKYNNQISEITLNEYLLYKPLHHSVAE